MDWMVDSKRRKLILGKYMVRFFWYNRLGYILCNICCFILPEKISDWIFMPLYEYPLFFGLTDKGKEALHTMIKPTLSLVKAGKIDNMDEVELFDLFDAGYIILFRDDANDVARVELTERGRSILNG